MKLAIEGTIIMSAHLHKAMDAMYDARVPEAWKAISWESSTLGFWFTEFLERNTQYVKWCFQVQTSETELERGLEEEKRDAVTLTVFRQNPKCFG